MNHFKLNIDCFNATCLFLWCARHFSTAVGLVCKDGVVLAVEKIVTSKLYSQGTNKRLFTVDTHAGLVSNIQIVQYISAFAYYIAMYIVNVKE